MNLARPDTLKEEAVKRLTLTKASVLLLAAILAGGFGLGGPVRAQTPEPEGELPEGTFVARVYSERVSDLSGLARYDVWEYNNLQERYVLVSMDRAILASWNGRAGT